ncbi:MAG: hypothetical protein KJO75_19960 [Dactylosporangium sp.]|nr:hypothetical protein [Dactylosporangium sp.]
MKASLLVPLLLITALLVFVMIARRDIRRRPRPRGWGHSMVHFGSDSGDSDDQDSWGDSDSGGGDSGGDSGGGD